MSRSGRPEGASPSRTRALDALVAWFTHHRMSALTSAQRMLRSPVASLLSTMVIGIALALPLGMLVALDNARSLSGGWDSPARLSVFLRAEVSEEAAAQMEVTIAARPDVAATELVSRAQALEEFRQLSGFGDVLRHLEDNPLPVLIIVSPGGETLSAQASALLQRELQAMAGVDEAVLDMAWVQRLNALMALGQRMVFALGLLFALGVLLIVGNTIRLAIENRRDEIVVVKLVGGSDAFVRRPFMYTGLWYGLGGAVLAWFIVALSLWGLRAPLAELANLYQSSFALRGLSVAQSVALLIAGSGLGLLGAWLAVARHLTAIQPR